MIDQLTVFVENTEGRLTALCRALGNAGINMHALTVADTSEYGIVRIICDQPAMAAEALTDAGFSATVTQVVGVEVGHTPGALADVFAALEEGNVNVEYSYCFANSPSDATVALKATESAISVLADAGFSIVDQADLI